MPDAVNNTSTVDEQTTNAVQADAVTSAQEFKAPSSQEELDRIIGERVARERKKYEGYDELKAKAEQFESVLSEKSALENKVAEFEAQSERNGWLAEISKEYGIAPDVLRGATRDELAAHAEQLKSFLIPQTGPVIPGQEKVPLVTNDDPRKEFLRGVLGKN